MIKHIVKNNFKTKMSGNQLRTIQKAVVGRYILWTLKDDIVPQMLSNIGKNVGGVEFCRIIILDHSFYSPDLALCFGNQKYQ